MAWFSTTVSPLRISGGNPVHFLIFFCKKKTAIANGLVFNDSLHLNQIVYSIEMPYIR